MKQTPFELGLRFLLVTLIYALPLTSQQKSSSRRSSRASSEDSEEPEKAAVDSQVG